MRIRQVLILAIFGLLTAVASSTFAQDYTPSAEVTTAIVDAQADGVVTDAEAASLAQAMAADGADAAAVATTLSANVGASSVQVAAGLAAVGQTQNQIASTLVQTGVASQADAQNTAQLGQQAAVATGNATVVTTVAQAATVSSNLQVTGSGLITDSSGRAVVVQNAGDQLLLVREVIRANGINNPNGGGFTPEVVQSINNVVTTSLRDLGVTNQTVIESALKGLQDELDFVNNFGADSITDDILGSAFDSLLSSVEEGTGTDLNNDGEVGASPSTVS